mmetsp:Transcript_27476/g.55410  ORF Transcript_27476/g.55410 Transcript_27476/m.55410 type:complete len:291 (-) Transcript_27476:156-1028(-)
MCRKHLRSHSVQVQIHKSAVGIVLDEASTVRILSRYESLDCKPRMALPIRHFASPGPYEVNLLGWVAGVELLRPVVGFVLQLDVIANSILGGLGRIDLLRVFADICLRNVVASPAPSILVEAMVGGALGRRGQLLHAVAVPHRAVSKGLRFHLDNRHLLGPPITDGIVLVADDTFRRYGRNVVPGPNVLFGNKFGRTPSYLGHECSPALIVRIGNNRHGGRISKHYRGGNSRPCRWLLLWFGRAAAAVIGTIGEADRRLETGRFGNGAVGKGIIEEGSCGIVCPVGRHGR